jgi:hypothetical protein
LQELFVDEHDCDLAGNLHATLRHPDVFAGADLLGLVGELLVVLQAFLRIGNVVLKCCLAVFTGQGVEAIAVSESQVFEIAAVGEGVLGENDVGFAFAGFGEEGGDEASGGSAAHVNHAGPQGIEDGVTVVEELFRRPIVGLLGHAVGFLDGRPDEFGEVGRLVIAHADFFQCSKEICGFRPVSGLHGGEEAVHLVGQRDVVMLGQGGDEFLMVAGKPADLLGHDFLRRAGGSRSKLRARARCADIATGSCDRPLRDGGCRGGSLGGGGVLRRSGAKDDEKHHEHTADGDDPKRKRARLAVARRLLIE